MDLLVLVIWIHSYFRVVASIDHSSILHSFLSNDYRQKMNGYNYRHHYLINNKNNKTYNRYQDCSSTPSNLTYYIYNEPLDISWMEYIAEVYSHSDLTVHLPYKCISTGSDYTHSSICNDSGPSSSSSRGTNGIINHEEKWESSMTLTVDLKKITQLLYNLPFQYIQQQGYKYINNIINKTDINFFYKHPKVLIYPIDWPLNRPLPNRLEYHALV
jgi:hypothetical protein